MCAGVWCNAKNTTRILIKENQTLVKLSHMRRTHRANEIVSHGGLTRATRMGYGNVCQTILRIHFKPFSASHVFAFLLYFPPPPPCPHPPYPTLGQKENFSFRVCVVSSAIIEAFCTWCKCVKRFIFHFETQSMFAVVVPPRATTTNAVLCECKIANNLYANRDNTIS